jgi:hypothetical protein
LRTDKSDGQLFIDSEKAYDLVRRDVLYNILTECGVPINLVGLIKMCLNETYKKIRISKNLSDPVHIQNVLKQGDSLSPFLSTALGCHQENIRKSRRMELNGTHQLMIYADDVNILVENINVVNKNKEALLEDSKEVGLEVNRKETKHMLVLPPKCRTKS